MISLRPLVDDGPIDTAAQSTAKRRKVWDDSREPSAATIAIPGDAIADANDWMRGHGTFLATGVALPDDADEGESRDVLASVAGTVHRLNRLVTVHALRSRYRPEVGDLVVARIVEVGPRRWKVEAGARQDAVLMLSSINLPGGAQRRKLESDELQMRAFFKEGDLLVAEVQAFFADGAMSLHTRSLKYGKLRNGVLVIVPPSLIVRLKSHFHSLPCGVDLIIGLNGHIWVSATTSSSSAIVAHAEAPVDAEDTTSEALYSSVNDAITPERREAVARVAAVVRLLAAHLVPITDLVVAEAYEASLERDDGMLVDRRDSLVRAVKDLMYSEAGAVDVIASVAASFA